MEMYVKLVNMPSFVVTALDALYAFVVEYAYCEQPPVLGDCYNSFEIME